MTDRLNARDTATDLGAPGVHLVAIEKADDIIASLSGAGWRISPISGDKLTTEIDAIAAIGTALGLGECATADDLKDGLAAMKLYPASEGALLVWNDADTLITQDPDGFATIVTTLDNATGLDEGPDVPFEIIVKVSDPDNINL